MIPALVLAVVMGSIGWLRASRMGGRRADKIQYAVAHGAPAFLVVLIAMTVAGHMGWLG